MEEYQNVDTATIVEGNTVFTNKRRPLHRRPPCSCTLNSESLRQSRSSRVAGEKSSVLLGLPIALLHVHVLLATGLGAELVVGELGSPPHHHAERLAAWKPHAPGIERRHDLLLLLTVRGQGAGIVLSVAFYVAFLIRTPRPGPLPLSVHNIHGHSRAGDWFAMGFP